MSLTFVKGAYFELCQFCVHDGSCELRHHEFMGVSAGPGIDQSPYPGHEDLTWHFSSFQNGSSRAHCTGRIGRSKAHYLPLGCECGTAVTDISCQKFAANEAGHRRRRLAIQIALQRGLELEKVRSEDLPPPEPYEAIMQ